MYGEHPTLKSYILNLVLLGISGLLLLEGFAFAFNNIMPTVWFIDHRGVFVKEVCLDDAGHYVLKSEIEREIYPFLPDWYSRNRSLEARGIGEVVDKNGIEIDSRGWEAVYQWEEDDIASVNMTYNAVIPPGEYQVKEKVIITIPFNTIVFTTESNFFRVDSAPPNCQ